MNVLRGAFLGLIGMSVSAMAETKKEPVWETDVFGNKRAMRVEPEAGKKLARYIQLYGFNCPIVTSLEPKPSDAYGEVGKLNCGHISFRATTPPGQKAPRIKPWTD